MPSDLNDVGFHTADLLHLRQQLMESNQREVADIIARLHLRLEAVEHRREIEVGSLESLLEATKEKLRVTARRCSAAESAMESLQQETDHRTAQLQVQLAESRQEFHALKVSMEHLLSTHKHAVATVAEESSRLKVTRKQQRAAEVREVELMQRVDELLAEVAALKSDAAAQQDRYQSLNQVLLSTEQQLSVVQLKLHTAESSRRSAADVTKLQERNRLLAATNRRLLKVMTYCGCDGDSTERLALLRFVTEASSGEFQFTGDATINRGATGDGKTLEKNDLDCLLDLKRCVGEFRSLSQQQQSIMTSPSVLYDAVDPMMRLRTERDLWLPQAVLHEAVTFRQTYFPNSPMDIFYHFLMRVASFLADRPQITTRTKQPLAASRAPPLSSSLPPSPPTASEHTITDSLQLDVQRSLAALRFLQNSFPPITGADTVQVRQMLTCALHTMESLIRLTQMKSPSKDGTSKKESKTAAASSAHTQMVHTVLQDSLALCSSLTERLLQVVPHLNLALKMPQSPEDVVSQFRRNCCAKSHDVVVTPTFRKAVSAACQADVDALLRLVSSQRDVLVALRETTQLSLQRATVKQS